MCHLASIMEQTAERLGTTIAGKYRLERLLGRGGGASVFLATQLAIGRSVAVKLLHPQAISESTQVISDRFEREARLISQLEHPNTITIYDYGDDGDELYLVMEYIEGPSLQALIKQQGRFEPSRAVKLAQDILRSIEEAHHFGILHRDLKPANIMITRDFKGNELAKVVDFGIAKLLHDDQREHGDLTQENAFVGTPRYSPPEQILAHDLTPAADLYGVGMIMWQMLTGKPAVATSKVKECLRAHLSRQPWVLPAQANIPPALAKIVESSLIKDPRHRYQRASDMLQDLERWMADPQRTLSTLSAPLPVSADTEDFWDFSSRQMIDPNVGQTSELLGMLVDAQAERSDDGEIDESQETALLGSMTSAALPQRPYHATQPQQWRMEAPASDEQIIAVADASSPATELVTETAHSELDVEPTQRLPSQRPKSSPSLASITPAPLLAPPRRPTDQGARPKLFIGGIVAAALLCAIMAGVFFWPQSSMHPPEPPQPELVSARSVVTPPPKTLSSSKFSEEGLELVLKSAGWRVEQRSELLDLESYRQRSMLISKGKSKVEVTFYHTKDTQLIAQLGQELEPRDRLERFEDKILKIHPRDMSSAKAFTPTLELLSRYRKLVLAGQTADPDTPTSDPITESE